MIRSPLQVPGAIAAVELANTEIAGGSNPDAKQMARTIAETRQREIDVMRQLLG